MDGQNKNRCCLLFITAHYSESFSVKHAVGACANSGYKALFSSPTLIRAWAQGY